MVHRMRLVDFAFNEMKVGRKDIEVRLLDEKRQLIDIGDIIEFQHIDTRDILRVKVTNLYVFNSFKDLFAKFDNSRLGIKRYGNASIMNEFYTKEEQEKYKALGIEVKII